MSLSVLTRGGGGGAYASIFVKGLSETDVVTATNGSKTKNGVWVTKTKILHDQPLIPVMTSNTTPSGVASASKITEGAAWKAFDGGSTTSGKSYSYGGAGSGTLPWYTQYEFPEEVSITSLSYIVSTASSGDNERTNGHEVRISQDGDIWETVWSGEISNGANNPISGTVNLTEAKRAKYIRWVTTTDSVGVDASEILFELQAYGDVEVVESGFEITKLGLDTWTVTATNGEDTATQDVLVDIIAEYEIWMVYDPIFRLDFADGTINPSINEQGAVVSTNGTVVLDEGSAYFNYNGEIRMTPPVFVSGAKSWHFKYKQTNIANYNSLYLDSNGTGATGVGHRVNVGSLRDTDHCFAQDGGGTGSLIIVLPTPVVNKECDLIITTTGDTTENGTKAYVDGELVGTGTLTLNSDSCNGSCTKLGYNYASPYGYAGYIYLYEFYDRELSADEVLALQ